MKRISEVRAHLGYQVISCKLQDRGHNLDRDDKDVCRPKHWRGLFPTTDWHQGSAIGGKFRGQKMGLTGTSHGGASTWRRLLGP